MSEFHLLRPAWLLLLLPLGWLLWRLRLKQGDDHQWKTLCDPHLLPHLLIPGSNRRQGWPIALLAWGWLLALLALAGPVWQRLPQPLYQTEGALVLLLDLSDTMRVTDLPPSRLERARFKLLDTLKQSQEGRVALIAFSGEPHTVAPLTTDAATVAALVPVLEPEIMPTPGKRLAPALLLADTLLTQAGMSRGGRIALFGDGSDDPAAVASAIRTVRDHGRTLFIIGLGTPEGAPIPNRQGGFVHDASGRIRVATLDEPLLQQWAALGGGQYLRSSSDNSDVTLLTTPESGDFPLTSQLQPAGGSGFTADLWQEEGPWLALLLLPVAVLAFRRGWLGVVLFVACTGFPLSNADAAWADWWRRPDQQGAELLEAGQPAAAAERFVDPAWQGTALYRAGEYAKAQERFSQMSGADGHYNRGNALALGKQLQEAVSAYQEALKQQPDHADAQHNLELVQKLLEEQKKQEQQEQKKNSQQDQQQSQGQDAQEQQSKEPQESKGDDSQDKQAKEQQAKEQQAKEQQAKEQQAKEQQAKEQQAKEQQAKEQQAQREMAEKQAQDAREQTASKQPPAGTPEQQRQQQESEQATEQWLRRIPDDPGGLLREKFLREAQRRHAGQSVAR